MLVRLDTRQNYGEDRWIGIGITKNRVVVVIYVTRINAVLRMYIEAQHSG